METIWAPDTTVVGIAVTIAALVIGATWALASKIGRLQRAVEDHGHLLSNGLVAEVKEHGLLLERLQGNQKRLIEDVRELHDMVRQLHEQINRRVAS